MFIPRFHDYIVFVLPFAAQRDSTIPAGIIIIQALTYTVNMDVFY